MNTEKGKQGRQTTGERYRIVTRKGRQLLFHGDTFVGGLHQQLNGKLLVNILLHPSEGVVSVYGKEAEPPTWGIAFWRHGPVQAEAEQA